MALNIRPADPADLPRVLQLCRVLDTAGEPGLPDAEAKFGALVAREGHCIYVAEEAGVIVGTFALIFLGGLAHAGRDSCIVEDVVVEPARQGSGIGREMMQFAMRACFERGCYKLVLSSHLQRERAHRFYEGLGFRKHGYSFLIDGLSTDPGAR
jgi:GNAT superfamily N-acetyltransferase